MLYIIPIRMHCSWCIKSTKVKLEDNVIISVRHNFNHAIVTHLVPVQHLPRICVLDAVWLYNCLHNYSYVTFVKIQHKHTTLLLWRTSDVASVLIMVDLTHLTGRRCVEKMTRRATAGHGCDWLSPSRDHHSKQREVQSTGKRLVFPLTFTGDVRVMTFVHVLRDTRSRC